MKIITNRRYNLSYSENCLIQDFYSIADSSEAKQFPLNEANCVYLMFSNDFLTEQSIDLIKETTSLLSKIPHNVPVCIAGIGTRFESEEEFAKLSLALLESIKEFLNEVFLHTSKIGVREDITRAFLSKVFSFTPDSFEVIYYKNKARTYSENLIADFLTPYNLTDSRDLCLVYNKKPFKAVDVLRKDFVKNIIVSKPFITTDGDKSYLNCNISIDGRVRRLWLSVGKEYEQYLDLDTADAFLLAMIPYAIRTNHNIVMEHPVSDEFFHNVKEYLLPNLYAADPRFYQIKVEAKTTKFKKKGNAVGCGLSCGVDSFYSLAKYFNDEYPSLKPTHIYVGNYLNESTDIDFICDKVHRTAKEVGLPVVQTDSNISSFYNRFIHIYVHFFKIIFSVYTLRSLFKTYIYATASNQNHFDIKGCSTKSTAKYELLLVATCNTSTFQIVESGAGYERHEKTQFISKFKPSYKTLHVCLDLSQENNCGVCRKCLRTLFALDLYDSLDNYSAVFQAL